MKYLSELKDSPKGKFWCVFLFGTETKYSGYLGRNGDMDFYNQSVCNVLVFDNHEELKTWMIENQTEKFTIQFCENFPYNFEVRVEW